ncbi:uncharacterized protein Mes2 isoform X1 [Eurosta solidaginis]|uniref:uncharacterized protein Mes2 isoform X1 n=2 Tax=Eurosta solidaginis TaxID=178769 RepID=UPI003530C1F1
MDAPRASNASLKPSTDLSFSDSQIKTANTSISSSSFLQLSSANSRRISTEEEESKAPITTNTAALRYAANIQPQSPRLLLPSPTYQSSPTSRSTSSSPSQSRLRVATPESDKLAADTAAAAATETAIGLGGVDMSGVSIASQLSAALDMKAKTSNSAVAAAVTAAVELMHAGTPTSQTHSQKIKKFVDTCVDFCDYKNNNNNMNGSCSGSVSCEQRILSPTITTTTITTITCAKSSLREFRRHSSPRLQQLYQPSQQVDDIEKQEPPGGLRLLRAPTLQRHKKQVVRRNASDKLRLIQMVHDNPILWDSRLPNFKGAEEEKNRAWEMIGKEFNAPGRRVARAFKSLRESYRRELAHVKLMGNGFKPKWSLYDAMDFLRDVIRERKGGSHAAEQAAIGLNLSAFSQHLNSNNNSKSALKLSALHSSFNESALNLSKCSPGLNMSHEDYYYYVKPELDMAAAAAAHAGSNGIGGGGVHGVGHPAMPPHPLPAHQSQQPHQQQLQQQHLQNASAHDSRVSSTRNDSNTQNSTTFDDLDASSVRSGDETSVRNADMSNQGSDEVEELEAIDADFPYPLILDANSPRSLSAAGGNSVGGGSKRKRRDLNGDAIDGNVANEDEDEYEGQMMQQHRHLRQQNGGSINVGGGGGGSGGGGNGSLGGMGGCMLDMPQPQTVREVLNSKFCGFISAKLNSMEDTEADNLMNKILMLLVQSQTQTQPQGSECK